MECVCIICKSFVGKYPGDHLRTPNAGLGKITQYGKLFERSGVLQSLRNVKKDDVRIHISCQKGIGNDIRKSERGGRNDEPVSKMIRRSDVDPFVGSEHCIICGASATDSNMLKHPDRQSLMISYPKNVDIKHLLELCDKPDRMNTDFIHSVRGRLMAINDLSTKRYRYHRICYRNFCRDDYIPMDEAPLKRSAGRPMAY